MVVVVPLLLLVDDDGGGVMVVGVGSHDNDGRRAMLGMVMGD